MTLPEGNYTKAELTWFRSIFDQYYEAIRGFAYFKTGDVDMADDIVQEVFLKIWNSRDNIKKETIKALLYTVATNIIKNQYKHKKVVCKFEMDYLSNDTPDQADANIRQQELLSQVEDTLKSMPEKIREVFLMNRIEGYTYNDIAERLGLSVKAIEKRMSEALALIRRRINYKI